jgi:hypothetical protein
MTTININFAWDNISFDLNNFTCVYVKFFYQFQIPGSSKISNNNKAKTKILTLDNIHAFKCKNDSVTIPSTSKIFKFKIKFPNSYKKEFVYNLSDDEKLFNDINTKKLLNIDITLDKNPIIVINDDIKHQASSYNKIKPFLLF